MAENCNGSSPSDSAASSSGEDLESSVGGPLCNVIVGGFATWTVLVHGAVAVGANLYQLLTVAALVLLGLCIHRLRDRRSPSPQTRVSEPVPRAEPSLQAHETAPAWRTWPPRILAFAAGVLFLWTHSWLLFWWTAMGLLTLQLVLVPPSPLATPRPEERRGWRRIVVLLGVASAVATLCAHRPDLDDAFYVGHAVGIADHPGMPILAQDNLHGIDGLPLPLAVYKVETLGVLIAALAFSTPLAALDIAHLVVPAVAALLVPLVYAVLFRRLLPHHWLWGIGIVLAFLWCAGDVHRSYGNFAFVRLFQGKAIFVTVVVPWILSSALTYGRAPSRRHWWRLAAAQVAGVGLSSTALLIAPAVAGIGLLAGIPWRRGFVRRLLIGGSASIYVLGLSLWMLTQLPSPQGMSAGSTPPTPDSTRVASTYEAPKPPATSAFEYGARRTLGSGWLASLAALTLLGAAVFGSGLGGRLAQVAPLGFLAILWNPYLADSLQTNVLGPAAYWRVFWALPLPVLLALLLTSPLSLLRPRLPPRSRQALTIGLIAIVLLASPLLFETSQKTWSRSNGVRWGWPQWKVPAEEMAVAQAIASRAPASATVLVPSEIAPWLVTLPNHPTPLMIRQVYVSSLRKGLGWEEAQRRERLVRWTESRRRAHDADLEEAIVHDRLRVICMRRAVANDPQVQALLTSSGFEPVAVSDNHAIWER